MRGLPGSGLYSPAFNPGLIVIFFFSGYLYFFKDETDKRLPAMKKYSTVIITILIVLAVIFIAMKWTKWDTIIIIVLGFAVAGTIIYRSLKKAKTKE